MRAVRRALAALSVALAFAAMTFALASPAGAQPVSLEGAPLEVQIWPGGEVGYTVFIVTGHIPEDVTLPATVRLPVFEGAEVVWSGEILGGPVADDPERAATRVEGTGGPALEITAETTRTVQYEAIGAPLSVLDNMTTSVFEWVQTVETGDVTFSVRVPASAGTVTIDPVPVGDPRVNDAGERLYTLRPAVLAPGDTFTVTAAYGPEGAGGGSGSDFPVLPVLLGLLAVAVAALVLALAKSRRAPA